jgi:hypothetical protein
MASQSCPHCGSDIDLKVANCEDPVRCPECGCALAGHRRLRSRLSRPLVPVPPGGPAWPKGRSILKENIIWLAVFMPLVALATAIIFWIISLVNVH